MVRFCVPKSAESRCPRTVPEYISVLPKSRGHWYTPQSSWYSRVIILAISRDRPEFPMDGGREPDTTTCSPRFLPNVVVRFSQVYAGSGAHQGLPHTAMRPRVSICLQGNYTTFQWIIYSNDIEIVNNSSPKLASETRKELASNWTPKWHPKARPNVWKKVTQIC